MLKGTKSTTYGHFQTDVHKICTSQNKFGMRDVGGKSEFWREGVSQGPPTPVWPEGVGQHVAYEKFMESEILCFRFYKTVWPFPTKGRSAAAGIIGSVAAAPD